MIYSWKQNCDKWLKHERGSRADLSLPFQTIFIFVTILPKQTLRGPKGYVQGPSKHFVYALWAHVRLYSHVTSKWKNSMLSGCPDKGSDWKNTSHVIGNRFIKISNKNVQIWRESLEGYPCFTPTPMVVHPCQFCEPIIFRERILANGGLKQISAKSGEGFISEKQQEQGNIQKFSSSDQRCCLSKGKSCLIDINGCVPFTLSSAFCLWIMYNRSIADGICSDGSSAYFILWRQVRNTAANVDTFHHKLILKTRVWFIFEILEHTSMLVWLVR